jgi:hypothetical protein
MDGYQLATRRSDCSKSRPWIIRTQSLFRLEPRDPATLAGAAAALIVVGALAVRAGRFLL